MKKYNQFFCNTKNSRHETTDYEKKILEEYIIEYHSASPGDERMDIIDKVKTKLNWDNERIRSYFHKHKKEYFYYVLFPYALEYYKYNPFSQTAESCLDDTIIEIMGENKKKKKYDKDKKRYDKDKKKIKNMFKEFRKTYLEHLFNSCKEMYQNKKTVKYCIMCINKTIGWDEDRIINFFEVLKMNIYNYISNVDSKSCCKDYISTTEVEEKVIKELFTVKKYNSSPTFSYVELSYQYVNQEYVEFKSNNVIFHCKHKYLEIEGNQRIDEPGIYTFYDTNYKTKKNKSNNDDKIRNVAIISSALLDESTVLNVCNSIKSVFDIILIGKFKRHYCIYHFN